MSPPVSIAATLIVRNEARCLARCLGSVAPWVDKMVVLDTGSTDDSVAIAQAAGAEVHHLPWPESFSIARNHLLDLADSDWALMLDADEWLVTGGELLREWCDGPARLGRVCIHNQHDDGETATRSWITRLIPRGAHYQGRVHEQVASPLPRVPLPLHVAHDGYLAAQIAPSGTATISCCCAISPSSRTIRTFITRSPATPGCVTIWMRPAPISRSPWR
ncbi:hypothetical protein GCM10020258_10900 [Sphingomonas yabuuchiae]